MVRMILSSGAEGKPALLFGGRRIGTGPIPGPKPTTQNAAFRNAQNKKFCTVSNGVT